MKCVYDKSEDVRYWSVFAITGLGKEAHPAVGVLCDALHDKSRRVKVQSARALGEIGAGATDAVVHLLPYLKSPHDDLRGQVAIALGSIGIRSKAEEAAVLEALKDQEISVRDGAAKALGKRARISSKALAAVLEVLLHDPADGVRLGAIEGLTEGKVSDKEVLAALRKIAREERPGPLQDEAVKALQVLADESIEAEAKKNDLGKKKRR
jgi:HEAT repeat protein